MTDLTEQWKKGELMTGVTYYVEDVCVNINALEYIDNGIKGKFSIDDSVIATILAPVPSYNEWLEKIKSLKVLAEAYCKEKQKNAELKDTIEALKSELKEVCDALIRKCPEMKEWVMLNWKNLYDVQDD